MGQDASGSRERLIGQMKMDEKLKCWVMSLTLLIHIGGNERVS